MGVRDEYIPSYLESLNELAITIMDEVNTLLNRDMTITATPAWPFSPAQGPAT
jgi:hypothetical protein